MCVCFHDFVDCLYFLSFPCSFHPIRIPKKGRIKGSLNISKTKKEEMNKLTGIYQPQLFVPVIIPENIHI